MTVVSPLLQKTMLAPSSKPASSSCATAHASRAATVFRAHPRAPSARGRARSVKVCASKKDEPDLIQKMFGAIFGKAALEDMQPAGLQRMTVEDWPDQWPPTTTEFAEPVEGDDPLLAVIRPLLKQTQLEKVSMGIAYDANVHGWSNEDFHTQVDGMGAAVMICETAGGALVGGYNPQGWLQYGDWRDAISAFLFTWPSGLDGEAYKLPKTGGSGMAIIDEPGKGPQWGPDGLKVNLSARSAVSRLGAYYERLPGSGRYLFAAEEGGAAEVVSCRVYVGLEETEKAKNYQPNMLQWQPGELEKLRDQDQR